MCIEKQGLKIEVNLSFEEFREQKIDRLYSSKWSELICMLLCFALLIENVVLLIEGERALVKIIFWSIVIASQPLVSYFGAKRLYKRTHGKSYTISEDGIICEKGTTEASLRYKWKDIKKIEEYDAAFVFYLSFAEFESPFIIPKSCFPDEREIQSLREFLEGNVKRYKVKMKTSTGG